MLFKFALVAVASFMLLVADVSLVAASCDAAFRKTCNMYVLHVISYAAICFGSNLYFRAYFERDGNE